MVQKLQAARPADEAEPCLTLDCGCEVTIFNMHGIQVKYCERHESFLYSPRYDGATDVIYFVDADNMP